MGSNSSPMGPISKAIYACLFLVAIFAFSTAE